MHELIQKLTHQISTRLLIKKVNHLYGRDRIHWRNQLHNGTRAADQFNNNHYLSVIMYKCVMFINPLMTNNFNVPIWVQFGIRFYLKLQKNVWF